MKVSPYFSIFSRFPGHGHSCLYVLNETKMFDVSTSRMFLSYKRGPKLYRDTELVLFNQILVTLKYINLMSTIPSSEPVWVISLSLLHAPQS